MSGPDPKPHKQTGQMNRARGDRMSSRISSEMRRCGAAKAIRCRSSTMTTSATTKSRAVVE